ncbi:MAG: hypothetical protein RL595_273 [Planctomycetota bacterium]|jgi:hypothetical protein
MVIIIFTAIVSAIMSEGIAAFVGGNTLGVGVDSLITLNNLNFWPSWFGKRLLYLDLGQHDNHKTVIFRNSMIFFNWFLLG